MIGPEAALKQHPPFLNSFRMTMRVRKIIAMPPSACPRHHVRRLSDFVHAVVFKPVIGRMTFVDYFNRL